MVVVKMMMVVTVMMVVLVFVVGGGQRAWDPRCIPAFIANAFDLEAHQ